MRSLRPLALLAALPFTSCAYMQARGVDLADSFLWRWHGEALGVAVEAKVGPLDLGVGGWYADSGTGKDTWWQQPGLLMTNHGYGVPFTTLSPLAYGASWSRLFATRTTGNHPAAPDAYDDATSWLVVADVFDLDDQSPFVLTPARRISDLFGIEVGVAPVLVQATVGFNVAEFADFLLGFVLLDVFGDDGVPRPKTVPFVPAAQRR
ncbi:MAG: hypothetical protein JNK15_00490 [Planctomycetes bacterium]|nr:hypothetical protein [Planctomycetota bacterium]